MTSTVYLSLGSSIEPRLKFLQFALDELKQYPFISDIKVSSVYETSPLGNNAKNLFLNLVVKITLKHQKPIYFLKFIQSIENKAGRTRTLHWEDRTLDLDILLWDSEIVNDTNLIIPHPELQYRDFVLKPLCEIAPDIIHPILGKSVSEIYSELHSNNIQNKYILEIFHDCLINV